MSINGATTLYQALEKTVVSRPTATFIADVVDGAYHRNTYSDILERVQNLAFGLKQLNLPSGDRVAFMVRNSSDWLVIDLACAQLGLINVPIHTTYSFQYVSYTLEHSGAKVLFIQDKLYQKFAEQLPQLKLAHIIIVGQNQGSLQTLTSLSREGRLQEYLGGDENNIHTIIYTSGTTAEPKGVMLSHKNILSNLKGAAQHVPISSADRFFSFLPLSHALERTGALYVTLYFGAEIYFSESTDTIARDIKLAKPTIMLAVPRIFEKVYARIVDKVENGTPFQKKLFFQALTLQRSQLNGQILSSWQRVKLFVLDIIVLAKIRGSLGGRLTRVISGGAALDQKIAKFFQTVGILILEGYGLTETSPVISVNKFDRYKFGSVGQVIPGMEIRLTDDKEILARGSSLMAGYFNNDTETKTAIDSQGWLHTGDMGSIDSDGFLTITGRIKELLILSNGKNVNPVPIEIALNGSDYISQSLVYSLEGDNLRAIIVPDFDRLSVWLRERGLLGDPKEYLANELVRQLFQEEIASKMKIFNPFEQIHQFKLIAEEFTQDNGLVTPTLKLRRKNILQLFLDM